MVSPPVLRGGPEECSLVGASGASEYVRGNCSCSCCCLEMLMVSGCAPVFGQKFRGFFLFSSFSPRRLIGSRKAAQKPHTRAPLKRRQFRGKSQVARPSNGRASIPLLAATLGASRWLFSVALLSGGAHKSPVRWRRAQVRLRTRAGPVPERSHLYFATDSLPRAQWSRKSNQFWAAASQSERRHVSGSLALQWLP